MMRDDVCQRERGATDPGVAHAHEHMWISSSRVDDPGRRQLMIGKSVGAHAPHIETVAGDAGLQGGYSGGTLAAGNEA